MTAACRCDPEVARDRFSGRAGTRLGGHFDSARTADELWNTEVAEPVAGGWPLLEVIEREIAMLARRIEACLVDDVGYQAVQAIPGVGPVLAAVFVAEIGDISRFASPKKLCGYTGLCPKVDQSGGRDRRGSLSKHGPRYLRWALVEASTHAGRHPAYAAHHARTKARLGRQRGPKVANIEIARKLTEAIWYMLSRNEAFAPALPSPP